MMVLYLSIYLNLSICLNYLQFLFLYSAIQIDRILVQVLLIHIHSSLFQLIDLSVQETASSDQSESGGEASPFLMSLEEQINESIAKYKDMQTAHQSRSYSIVKAVGQVALSAAIGVVKTIGFGASAIIEARREALDHNTKLNYSTPTASRLSSPRTGAVAIRQDDDVEENEESGADLVSRLNLTSSANRHASK